MAVKKTAKNTSDTLSENSGIEAAPAAKKAAKKVAKKVAAKKTAKPPAAKAPKPARTKPTPDAITRAAYLIYRHRVENGLPGDSHNDWLEAERQLSIKD